MLHLNKDSETSRPAVCRKEGQMGTDQQIWLSTPYYEMEYPPHFLNGVEMITCLVSPEFFSSAGVWRCNISIEPGCHLKEKLRSF